MDGVDSSLLLLNACQGVDSEFLERLGWAGCGAESFLKEGVRFWREQGFSERNCRHLSGLLESGWAGAELERSERSGVRILTLSDPDYPENLRSVPNVPLALYTQGQGLFRAAGVVAVVGTRRCSAYGARCARSLGRALGQQGNAVVSGGALGVDGAAHGGALEAGGTTWAVLGTGVDVVYPREHGELFGHISERGLLISQFPLGTEARPWRFPLRNRVVAALAERLVVVEAPARSGALITARQALEMGKEVWAIPGRIGERVCEGSNRLLFDGAYPLVDLREFTSLQGQPLSFTDDSAGKNDTHALTGLSADEKRLLSLLRSGGDRTIDSLAVEGKMAAADVNRLLMLLSARGAVFSSGGGRWSASPES